MKFFLAVIALMFLGCHNQREVSQESKDAMAVQQQQSRYSVSQPIPVYDWSLERDLVIDLYNIRNDRVATHSVWRSDFGQVEGDCPSMGYGIPYDTSLTNPLQQVTKHLRHAVYASDVIEQAEPNGVFASKNTAATWVMCVGSSGVIEPMYIETKVTVYPGPVEVDYDKNRVTRVGDATVTITK